MSELPSAAPRPDDLEHRHFALSEDHHVRAGAQYIAGLSLASGPLTATLQPRSAASEIIASADSRRAVVHILVRKLKLSSITSTASGWIWSSLAAKRRRQARTSRRTMRHRPFAPKQGRRDQGR